MSETDPRPMGRLQNKDSQKRYAAYVKRLVCYSLRVLDSVDALGAVDSEGDGEGEGARRIGRFFICYLSWEWENGVGK